MCDRVRLLCLMCILAGCLDDLPKYERVESLRILAVQAVPPEVGPGDGVSLEALVVDADEREITVDWAVCLLPERAFGFFSDGGSGR